MARAICFDLDDTLYPYEQYVRAGFRAAADSLAETAGVDVYDDLVAAYDDGIRDETFDHVLASRGLPTDRIPNLVTAFHERVGPLEPYSGATDALETLGKSHRLGLITDGRNGREKLAELALESTFESVWVSPERGVSKRRPEPFETTLADLGVRPSEAVYVGDHPSVDLEVPSDLGMTTVRVRQGRYAADDSVVEPDVELESVAELPAALGADRRAVEAGGDD